MVIGYKEVLIIGSITIFLGNLILGIILLSKESIGKRLKITTGTTLIILSIFAFFLFLVGLM